VIATVLFAAEGKFEAHHPWWPEGKEILWGGLAFLIVGWILWKFAGPALAKGLRQRSETIGTQLADAAAARSQAQTEAAAITSALGDIATEKARIIEQARSQADTIRTEGLARVEAELAETRARALADIEASKNRAVGEVQAEIAVHALAAAERVVVASLDDARKVALVEEFIAKVGAQGMAGVRS
jgi:F-type H+-transporting ATPase subunit b